MVEVPQESLKRWTSSEVRRLVESGAVENPESYELVAGLILEKHRKSARHVAGCIRAFHELPGRFGECGLVVGGIALALSPLDEPEPDVMVVTPGLRRDLRATDILLVLEVSDASLRVDQTVKAALYASHGIPEYVLLDVTGRRAEIRRRPKGEAWGETLILTEDGEFTPLGASGPIRVADLLPEP